MDEFHSFFPQMRSERFSFYILGVWGWRCVCLILLLVSATVRKRSQPSVHDRRGRKVGVSIGEATKTCLSRRVRRCQKIWSCRFAWQAWHSVTLDVCEEECVCTTVVRLKLASMGEATNKGATTKRVYLRDMFCNGI